MEILFALKSKDIQMKRFQPQPPPLFSSVLVFQFFTNPLLFQPPAINPEIFSNPLLFQSPVY